MIDDDGAMIARLLQRRIISRVYGNAIFMILEALLVLVTFMSDEHIMGTTKSFFKMSW